MFLVTSSIYSLSIVSVCVFCLLSPDGHWNLEIHRSATQNQHLIHILLLQLGDKMPCTYKEIAGHFVLEVSLACLERQLHHGTP